MSLLQRVGKDVEVRGAEIEVVTVIVAVRAMRVVVAVIDSTQASWSSGGA